MATGGASQIPTMRNAPGSERTAHATCASYGDAANLRAFLDAPSDASGGLLLYSGREVRRLGERILAAPWWAVAGM